MTQKPDLKSDEVRDAEAELNCAEDVLDSLSVNLDMEKTDFDCIGEYITAVFEAHTKKLTAPKQEHGEPVGDVTCWTVKGNLKNHDFDYYGNLPDGTHLLYTTPQQRKRLNEVKLKALYKRIIRSEDWSSPAFHSFSLGFRVAETEHGIKE